MSRRRARIGIEIGPEAVRAVALLGRRAPFRLAGVAEARLGGIEEVPAALAEVLGRLGAQGPAQVVLLGMRGHHLRLRLPPMRRTELEEAVNLHLAQVLEEPLPSLLVGRRVRREETGERVVDLLALPREPLETWCGQLAASGCPALGLRTPAATALAGDPRPPGERHGGLLWVDAGGTRTVLTFLRGDEIVLVREIPRREPAGDDQLARIERRLADFQEIERSILYYRQHHDRRGVRQLVLCGAAEEVTALHEQIAPPLRELEIEVRVLDAWERVAHDGEELPAEAACRLALAARAAILPPGRGLVVVPPATLAARRRVRRERVLAGLAAALLAASGALAWQAWSAAERARAELDLARGRLAALPVPRASARGPEVRARPPRVPDWSGVLSEIGILARPGIDYDELELVVTPEGPVVGVAGTAGGRDTRATGLLLAGLHEGILASAFSRGIPRLAAATDPAARRGERVRYALEGRVADRPAAGDGGGHDPGEGHR